MDVALEGGAQATVRTHREAWGCPGQLRGPELLHRPGQATARPELHGRDVCERQPLPQTQGSLFKGKGLLGTHHVKCFFLVQEPECLGAAWGSFLVPPQGPAAGSWLEAGCHHVRARQDHAALLGVLGQGLGDVGSGWGGRGRPAASRGEAPDSPTHI